MEFKSGLQYQEFYDSPVTIPIKHPEGLPDVLRDLILHDLLFHHLQDLIEIQTAVTIFINLECIEFSVVIK